MNTTEYKDADETWEAGNKWVQATSRWDKLHYLTETAPELQESLVNEMARFMSEESFNEFFTHLRRNWDVKTPQELDYAMNS
jgi:hypothetical protein